MVKRLKWVGTAAKKLTSKLMVAFLIVSLIAFLGLFLWQSVQIQQLQSEYDNKAAEIKALKERNGQLQEHLDFYKGPGYMLYVEKVAREALGLAKPGETVVLTVSDNGNRAVPPSKQALATDPVASSKALDDSTALTGKKKPNWQSWLEFFTGH